MMPSKKKIALAAAVAATLAAPGAFATSGYLPHGIGTSAKAMGGVGIATSQDAMSAASNPANLARVGSQFSYGMDWFGPSRAATHISSGTDTHYTDSESKAYLMPELGYARPLGTDSSLGFVMYGAGLGVDYGKPWAAAGGTTNLFMLLKQLYVAPTWAMKMGSHSIGVSVNLVQANFDVRGLQGFTGFTRSGTTNNLTDQGEDGATGIGVKLGWVGEIAPNLSIGATLQPKTNMSKFSRYKELFAEQGDMDIPQQIGAGIAFKPGSATTLGFDIVSIKWSDVKSLGNRYDANPSASGGYLGDNNGIGFGWVDQTVYKLGLSHNFGTWTLRAGYNMGKSPVQPTQTLFNTLAPAVTEKHLTVGASWALSNSTDLSLTYMKSPESTVKGSGSAPNGMTNPSLRMDQYSIGLALSVRM